LLHHFKEGDASQQSLAMMVLMRPSLPEMREHLPVLYDVAINWDAPIEQDERLSALLSMLGRLDPTGEWVLRFLRETVRTGNGEHFELVFANWLVHYANRGHQRGFGNFQLLPNPFQNEQMASPWSGRSQTPPHITAEFSPFGEDLLQFLQEEGLQSTSATIRATSQAVIDVLVAITP